MRRIDVEEFSKNTDLYIQLANAGETIEVTEGGVPVARITPVPDEKRSTLEELAAQGLVILGTQDWAGINPVPARDGEPTLTEILMEMREGER